MRLQADGQTIGGLQVDPAGNFADTLLAPTLASPSRTQQTFELAAVDDAGNRAVVPLRITRVTADLPERARPGSRVRYRVTGFPVDRVVFLHVRRGGRTLGSFRIGRTAAPCGVAQRRLKYMPLKRWRTGSYDYWFQQSRRFSADAPSVRIRIAIVRRVRPA